MLLRISIWEGHQEHRSKFLRHKFSLLKHVKLKVSYHISLNAPVQNSKCYKHLSTSNRYNTWFSLRPFRQLSSSVLLALWPTTWKKSYNKYLVSTAYTSAYLYNAWCHCRIRPWYSLGVWSVIRAVPEAWILIAIFALNERFRLVILGYLSSRLRSGFCLSVTLLSFSLNWRWRIEGRV